MKPIAIIQARSGSTRLPKKVLALIGQHTVLEQVVLRCRQSKKLANIIVATTELSNDDPVAALSKSIGVSVYRGSELDVLDRYLKAAGKYDADVIVRITGDCPLIDPGIIDEVLTVYQKDPSDYVFIDNYPNGLGAAEVMTTSALRRAWQETTLKDSFYREHVMTYMTANPDRFKLVILNAPVHLRRPEIRLSIDEAPDLEVVRKICAHFSPRLDFGAEEIIEYLDKHPEILSINQHVKQISK